MKNYRFPKLRNWSNEQQQAFMECLENHAARGNAVPDRIVHSYRRGMRDRGWSPEKIRKHIGLLPCD